MQITKVIKEHGLTITEVAERMGVTKGTLSNTISHRNMTVSKLRRIAQAVGCSISEFLPMKKWKRIRKKVRINPISRR